MKKLWARLLSGLLVGSMTLSLVSGAALAAEPGTTTTTEFPEYYTQHGTPLRGTDYVQEGLKMTDEQIDQKIEALLNTMTLDEKYTYLGGNGTGTKYGNAGYLPGTPRLGVPEMRMHDGPAGVLSLWPTTNTPDRQMTAATWDDELVYQYGKVYGSENRAAGANMQLGSQYDITRTPEFGRANDQYGEDPYLLSRLAAAETKGMQDQGVIAVGKHYAAFAQSASPAAKTDISVSEQALHELYLPAFESAIKEGGMLGLMSSYNSINGTFASAQVYLQLDVLRDLWGYKGFTITDWGGNDGFTLNKGTDVEMPSLSNNKKGQDEVAAGNLTQAELDQLVDDAVRHVLYAFGHAGYLYLVETYEKDGKLYAKEETGRTEPIKLWGDSAEMAEDVQADNNDIVLEVARGGGVLLENDGTLPIADGKSVAVLGTGGKYTLSGTGGERSYGVGYEMTSPYEYLKTLLGEENVSLEPVFDNGGATIPAENLFVKNADGSFTQGFSLKKNDAIPKTVTGQAIEYLPDARSFEGGTALDGSKENPDTYTWTTYIKVNTTGEYTLVLQGLGGTLTGDVTEVADGDTASEPSVTPVDEPAPGPGDFPWGGGGGSNNDLSVGYSNSQGAHWHSGDYCTDTGMSISSGHKVTLEAGKYYKVEITGKANRDEKDMQLRLAWLTPATSVSYNSETDQLSGGAYDNAMKLAAAADVTVVFVDAKAQDKPSTRDPDNLNVSAEQERLVLDAAKAAHDAGKKIVVVVNNETAITIHNWVDQVDAVLMMYRPGQKGGQATAELLTGVVNPSGKLAYAMPMEGNQTLITYTEEAWNRQTQKAASGADITADTLYALNDGELERYWRQVNMDLQIRLQLTFSNVSEFRAALAPGAEKRDSIAQIVNNKVNSGTISYYDEGILTGYRFYDSENLKPRYDFGYGLSFTTFEYSDLSVTENKNGEKAGYDVTFTVKNTGGVTGSEVAQVYLGQAKNLPDGIQSAPYQLAQYTKIKDLKPGESKTVTLHVNERSLSYWNQNLNDQADKWTVAEGSRTIYVGAASDDLKLSQTVTVGKSSGGSSGGGSGSSSGGSSSGSTTTKNPDGSTTTKTENKSTGTVTETTKYTDGSQIKVETKKDGSITATLTKKTDPVITLPISEVSVTKDPTAAPAITLNTGSTEPVKVEIPADATSGTVAVLVKADGTEEILKTSIVTETGVVAEVSNGDTIKLVDNSKTFADVSSQHWGKNAVDFVSARNLFSGTGEDTFSPDIPMTRAMMMTVLASFDGVNTNGGSTWYEKGMEWAVSKGVSDGSNPEGNITREQLVMMLWRYAGSPEPSGDLSSYSDSASISSYATDAMTWAVQQGLVSGMGNNTLVPQGNATRVQLAQILKNFIEL